MTSQVDHGETGCKTPDAALYIQKTPPWRAAKGKSTRREAAGRTTSASRRAGD